MRPVLGPVLRRMARDGRGASAVEFALIAPLVIALLLGTLNLGIYFLARNAMSHAVDEAARFATIFPTPTNGQISSRFNSQDLDVIPQAAAVLTITRGTVSAKVGWIEMRGVWSMPVSLGVADLGTLPVAATRRVFVAQ